MGRKRVPLGNYVTEYSVRNKGDEDIPVYSVTNSQGFCTDYFDKEVASKDKKTYKIVPKGYFAYNPSRINVGSVDWQKYEERVIVSPLYIVFSVSENLEQQYLFYFLRSDIGKQMIKSKVSGSVRDNLKIDMLKEMTIPERSVEGQKKCVHILDTLKIIISLRKKELDKLDTLIKARFVEMFVSKNYPREELDNLSYGKGEYGAQSASAEYNSSRPRYVRITDIKEDGSLNDDVVCSANVEDDELYKLKYGDFCFARMGATVGKTYAYRGGNQIFAGYLIRYKLNLNRIIPEYLYEFTRLHEYRNWVSLNQSGAAQPGINAKKYGSLRIPVAPLEEQRVFAKFVEQVNKSKLITSYHNKSIYKKT